MIALKSGSSRRRRGVHFKPRREVSNLPIDGAAVAARVTALLREAA